MIKIIFAMTRPHARYSMHHTGVDPRTIVVHNHLDFNCYITLQFNNKY